MDDDVEPFEVLALDVSDVFADAGYGGNLTAASEGAVFVEIAVQSDHVVARLQQHRHHHRSNVALMACDHYTHDRSPCSLHDDLPDVERFCESVRRPAFRPP